MRVGCRATWPEPLGQRPRMVPVWRPFSSYNGGPAVAVGTPRIENPIRQCRFRFRAQKKNQARHAHSRIVFLISLARYFLERQVRIGFGFPESNTISISRRTASLAFGR
jgi:hypothetical protein